MRVVIDAEHWTAFVPATTRWPVEAHLVRVVPDVAALSNVEWNELAVVDCDLRGQLERYSGPSGEDLPYVAAWHQVPVHTVRGVTQLHLRLFFLRRAPRKLKYLAWSELGMAAWLNDALPKKIAQQLCLPFALAQRTVVEATLLAGWMRLRSDAEPGRADRALDEIGPGWPGQATPRGAL